MKVSPVKCKVGKHTHLSVGNKYCLVQIELNIAHLFQAVSILRDVTLVVSALKQCFSLRQ